MFWENDEDIILKMQLIDTIAEAKDSIDIVNLQFETEYIFDSLKESIYEDNTKEDYEYLKVSISNAQISYKLNPYMSTKNRIFYIYGMNYATEFLTYCEEVNEFKNLSLDEKINLAINTYELVKTDVKLDIYGKDENYFKNGIEAIIKIKYSSNKKKKK